MVKFDDKLQYYYKSIDEIQKMPLTQVQGCIELRVHPLASSIKEHALQWIVNLGKLLHDSAWENLLSLTDLIKVS